MRGERFLVVVSLAFDLDFVALRFAMGLRGYLAAAPLIGPIPITLTLILLPAYPLLASDIYKYIDAPLRFRRPSEYALSFLLSASTGQQSR